MGLPCSGKSTYIAKNFPGVEVFDERKLSTLGRLLRYLSAAAWEKMELVVVEGVLADPRTRGKIMEWAYNNDYVPHCVFVDATLLNCISRNSARNKDLQVRPAFIKKVSKEIRVPSTFDGFASVKKENGNGEETV